MRAQRAVAALTALVVLSIARTGVAQVAPDSVRPDTLRVPIPAQGVEQDTLPPDSALADAPDTVLAPSFPRYPDPLPRGWGSGRWELGRDQLARYHALTLLELLERVPGLTVIRSGDHGYPAGVTALGLGGGRTRLFVDGYELDPLGEGTPELQHLGVIDLESVRVERRLSGLRIELITARLPEQKPYSAVAAGTGTYDSKLLRGLLIRGFGRRSMLTGAYDAVSTRGFAFRNGFNMTSARAAWSYALDERTALQLELRNAAVERSAEPFVENADRRSLLFRGRSELRPGVWVDGALGRSWRTPGSEDDLLTSSLASTQAFVRASMERGPAWVEGSARARTGALTASPAPTFELTGRAVLRPAPWGSLEGEARAARLGGKSGLVWQATARAGQPGGLGAFASLSSGAEVLASVRDTTWERLDEEGATVAFRESRYAAMRAGATAARVGAEWSRGPTLLGVAGVARGGGTVIPFGLAFDRGTEPVDAQGTTGLEARATARLGRLFTLDAAFLQWLGDADRPYLPSREGRASLVSRGSFFEGQLEPSARLDFWHRGDSQTFGTGGAGQVVGHTLVNLFLEVRIQDVQAFGTWENLLNDQLAEQLPGRPLPGQRLIYGIRWVFRD